MPTGYTYKVQEGKVTEFKDFAMDCVRGMGVCIMMRDEPADAPIPDRWEPNVDYHLERIGKAVKRKEELSAMSKADVEQECLKAFEKANAEYLANKKEKSEEQKRYEVMLAKVEAWKPPTEEHNGFKEFMVSQLKESIRFDCGYTPKEPVLKSAFDWISDEMALVDREIEYHTKGRLEEIERTESRNKWMAELRKSLA